ncbi:MULTISPECIES: hypothetical protein [Pseudomonas]|nr:MULTISPECIES: hypothetical protein [Pseudomonas]MBA1270858.1 hypothetical protein [Pseudomonas carnis]MBA1301405.1 hypothetical protein [Pseudomonas carnis]MBJ2203989.1 hypothetical protein [Pseudomonas carnis]MCP9736131.1 hypothetical protein [Pseudomonas sp. GBPI_506]
MPEIKERPILFSAPMVRAILEGRKTVTRRALNAQALKNIGYGVQLGECHELPSEGPLHPNSIGYYIDFCPFGQLGDRLWVRETWQDVHPVQVIDRYSQLGRAGIPGPPGVTYHTIYRADGEYPKVHYTHEHPYRCIEPDPNHGFLGAADSGWTGWTPSIHMPRWASRILLEITDVRVERLQDITEAQAKAEGCFFTDYGQACFHGGRGIRDATECEYPASKHQQRPGWMWDKTNSYEQCLDSARHAFGNLWNSVGGDWEDNPWVWVVEFKRVTP